MLQEIHAYFAAGGKSISSLCVTTLLQNKNLQKVPMRKSPGRGGGGLIVEAVSTKKCWAFEKSVLAEAGVGTFVHESNTFPCQQL